MLVLVVSIFSLVFFIYIFIKTRIHHIALDAASCARDGVMAMLKKDMQEDEKEAIVKASGLLLLRLSLGVFFRAAICLIAAGVPIYLSDVLDVVKANTVINLMMSWDYIIITSVVILLISWLVRYSHHNNNSSSDYSFADQLVHKLAFSGPNIQLTASDIEDRIYSRRIREIEDKPPIFITSLPRAGTTILLRALNDSPYLATHLYRDMPFVMSPMLWSHISRMFIKNSNVMERAHKDGIDVGYDSPEAFEEVIWRTFWPEKYKDNYIDLWSRGDVRVEARDFFINHFRKIVSLRTENGRYISKNNNNISRLDVLPEMFPDAQIVVPLREPSEHCFSLLQQHRNFLEQHRKNPFTETYMRDIGHYEFGILHKPFMFPSFIISEVSPDDADYWMDYWISAYQKVLENPTRLHIISHDKICNHPNSVMHTLCERINLNPEGLDLSKHYRGIKKKDVKSLFDDRKLAKALELYHALLEFEI